LVAAAGAARGHVSTWLGILVVVVAMHTPGDATVTAQRLVNWYAARGISIVATVGEPVMLASNPCDNPGWWRYVPRQPGMAYLYLVDMRCPVWAMRVGVAMPAIGVAFVAMPMAGMDAVVAHEVGHLLGASDHADGHDLMSPNMWVAYADGQLSVESWGEMGGAVPDHVALLPEVSR
jgi:hypothetical protein